MKIIPAALAACFALTLLLCITSCRVSPPINPNTGRQDPSLFPYSSPGYSMPEKKTGNLALEVSK
ncbi:MAG: hypothetical protein ACO3SO_09345 [Luteolibacter sp.]